MENQRKQISLWAFSLFQCIRHLQTFFSSRCLFWWNIFKRLLQRLILLFRISYLGSLTQVKVLLGTPVFYNRMPVFESHLYFDFSTPCRWWFKHLAPYCPQERHRLSFGPLALAWPSLPVGAEAANAKWISVSVFLFFPFM